MSRRYTIWLAVAGIASVVAFAVAGWFDPGRKEVWISIAQGVPIFAALLLAAKTLVADRDNRRVDRALALHRELITGELGDARWRLANHLRLHAPPPAKVRAVTLTELQASAPRYGRGTLPHYKRQNLGTPRHDATLLLRFFEHVDEAWNRDAIDRLMLCRLIGRHVGWWDLALIPADKNKREREPLTRLAFNMNVLAETHRAQEDFDDWWHKREDDFGSDRRLKNAQQQAQQAAAEVS